MLNNAEEQAGMGGSGALSICLHCKLNAHSLSMTFRRSSKRCDFNMHRKETHQRELSQKFNSLAFSRIQ